MEAASKPTQEPAPELPYRQGASAIIVHPESGQVLCGQRQKAKSPDTEWQFCQGGIDEGEEPLTGCYRELKEEMGLASEAVTYLGPLPSTIKYDFPPSVSGKGIGAHFKGQEMHCFLFTFSGAAEDCDLSHIEPGHTKPEFRAAAWKDWDWVIHQMVAFKKPLYEEAKALAGPILAAKALPYLKTIAK